MSIQRLQQTLRSLYHGRSTTALRFQWAVVVIDLAIIGFFLLAPIISDKPVYFWLDYTIALVVAADLVARALAAEDIRKWVRQLDVWIDLLVLATLLAPLWLANLSFLRALRLWTLSRTDVVWRPLRKRGLESWENATRAIIRLVTFLFVFTGFVYTTFAGRTEGLTTYVDALYFTVATVTTTGFGDITLPGPWGKLTSVVAMIAGISLFVQLAQAIFRPRKVSFRCPQCALMRHEPDAVFCKACGHPLKIPNEEP
ncbi:ion channel [Flaviflagellibacter deserti]|uniref:Ion channel n=1 Tax=Flaviflagellibacter deserti TaxID=2267266 RepID=A0ABV9Z6B6_9HYPH